MPFTINHAYVATGTDAGNGEVHKSQWNADHSPTFTSSFLRNRVINGDMRFDQRNEGASISNPGGSGKYGVDRWVSYGTQASKFTAQRSTTAAAGYNYSNLITSSSAYSVLSSDFFLVYQAIEGVNAADLGWGAAGAKTVTLSFWVRSSLTGTFGGSLQNFGAGRSYPFTYSISAANTWEQKTVTVAGDTSGTWLTDTSAGIVLVFSMGAGSTFSGTANTWASANYYTATGATSVVGTNGATFYFTGVQLEEGSVATAFERRPYAYELFLCQRYYQKTYAQGTVPGTATRLNMALSMNTGGQVMTEVRWFSPMRAAPTISYWDGAGNASKNSYFLSAVWNDNTNFISSFNQTSTQLVLILPNASLSTNVFWHFAVEAEL